MDTHVRLNARDSIVQHPLQVEERVAAAEAFIASEVTRHLTISLRGRSFGCCSARLGTGRFLTIAGSFATAATAKLDVVQNDYRHAALLLGLLVLPDVFVIAADQIDVGTFFELHTADAIDHRSVEALHRDVDPPMLLLGPGIIDFGADTEPHEVPFIRELDCGVVLVALGYDYLGCEEF